MLSMQTAYGQIQQIIVQLINPVRVHITLVARQRLDLAFGNLALQHDHIWIDFAQLRAGKEVVTDDGLGQTGVEKRLRRLQNAVVAATVPVGGMAQDARHRLPVHWPPSQRRLRFQHTGFPAQAEVRVISGVGNQLRHPGLQHVVFFTLITRHRSCRLSRDRLLLRHRFVMAKQRIGRPDNAPTLLANAQAEIDIVE